MNVKKKLTKTSKTKQVVDWLAQQMETNSDNDDDDDNDISTDNNNKRKGNNSNSFFINTGSKKKMKQPTIDSSLEKCSPELLAIGSNSVRPYVVRQYDDTQAVSSSRRTVIFRIKFSHLHFFAFMKIFRELFICIIHELFKNAAL